MKYIMYFTFSHIFLFYTAAYAQEGVIFLSFYIGTVKIKSAKSTIWEPVQIGQILNAGDVIKTLEESRVEIKLSDGSVVRLSQHSEYTIEHIGRNGNAAEVKSYLSVGKAWSNINKLTRDRNKFTVQSPTAVAAIRGTIYNFTTSNDSTSTIQVYAGEVEVRNPESAVQEEVKPGFVPPREINGPQRIAPPQEVSIEQWLEVIKAQQQIVISRSGTRKVSSFDLNKELKRDWVKWNSERDKALKR